MVIVIAWLKQRFFPIVSFLTIELDDDHRGGLRLLARLVWSRRLLMVLILALNFLSAVFEGGTMGILVVAVSVLIDQGTFDLGQKIGFGAGFLGFYFSEISRAGLFLILVLAAVVAQVTKSALVYGGKRLSIRLQFAVSLEMQALATNHVMSFSYAEISSYSGGALGARISQAGQFGSLVSLANAAILSIFMTMGYLAFMIAMSPILTLAAVGVVICLVLTLQFTVSLLNDLGSSAAKDTVLEGQATFQFLQAGRLLRVLNVTEFAGASINALRRRVIDARMRMSLITAWMDPLIDAITILAGGTFLLLGFVLAGESAVAVIPKLLLFLLVLNRMMPQMKNLNQCRMGFIKDLAMVKLVVDLLRKEDKEFLRHGGETPEKFGDDIIFSNVSFKYPQTTDYVLRDVSFSLKKGKVLALVGMSGAGKSTVADLLLGLYEASNGQILVDGKNLNTISRDWWSAQIGVVDQDIFLLNTTVAKNIAFAAEDYSTQEIIVAARAAFAHDFISTLSDGYETIIGDRGHKISGGQVQRLGLARALLRAPDILVLDEATSSLDSESERMIQQTIEGMHEDRTLLIIAHRLSTIKYADEIVVLDHGRIIERGSLTDLLSQDGQFSKIWHLQHSQV